MPFNTQPPYNINTTRDVTATRALDTIYTNDTGRTMFLYITMRLEAPALNDTAIASAITQPSNMHNNVYLKHTGGSVQLEQVLSMVVKPGDTYQVEQLTSGMGTVGIQFWIETF